MESKEKPILSVRIDAAILRELDALCVRTGVGRAEIVERCLAMGLADDKEIVQWLEHPIGGAAAKLLTHPRLLAVLFGAERIDPTYQKIVANVTQKQSEKRASRRKAGGGRPATAG